MFSCWHLDLWTVNTMNMVPLAHGRVLRVQAFLNFYVLKCKYFSIIDFSVLWLLEAQRLLLWLNRRVLVNKSFPRLSLFSFPHYISSIVTNPEQFVIAVNEWPSCWWSDNTLWRVTISMYISMCIAHNHPWEIWLLSWNPVLESSCTVVKWVLALMW